MLYFRSGLCDDPGMSKLKQKHFERAVQAAGYINEASGAMNVLKSVNWDGRHKKRFFEAFVDVIYLPAAMRVAYYFFTVKYFQYPFFKYWSI